MTDWSKYDDWVAQLRLMAEINGVDLKEDRFHYRTYFAKGYKPQEVVSDIQSQPKPLTQEEINFQRFCD